MGQHLHHGHCQPHDCSANMGSQRTLVSYPPRCVPSPPFPIHIRVFSNQRVASTRITDLSASERKQLTYGPAFKYTEFQVAKSKVSGVLASLGLILGMMSLLIPPIRWLFKKLAPKSGEGPSPEYVFLSSFSRKSTVMRLVLMRILFGCRLQKNGWLKVTNITSSVATPSTPKRHVRTMIHGKGDPGYALTSRMFSLYRRFLWRNY